jgi:hypothetical protein
MGFVAYLESYWESGSTACTRKRKDECFHKVFEVVKGIGPYKEIVKTTIYNEKLTKDANCE